MGSDAKKIFLLAGTKSAELRKIAAVLQKHFEGAVIYNAGDGSEALLKMQNVLPNVLITELEMPKLSGTELVRTIIHDKKFSAVSVLALSDIPDQEEFVEEVVSGRLQFLAAPVDENKLVFLANRALMRSSQSAGQEPEFKLRNVKAGEVLFHEGEAADCAYLVKKGKLKAYKKIWGAETKTLGEVLPGEFVGEMAHLNGEPRSADVEAVEDSELIVIPLGTLDMLLFSKPAWSKALMRTLSRRLKAANTAPGGGKK